MKINILISQNPFFSSNASSNRWQTLIEGLLAYGVEIEILITSGYQTPKEEKTLGVTGNLSGVKYHYINPKKMNTLWKRRYQKYVSSLWRDETTLKKTMAYLTDSNSIVWSERSMLSFQTTYRLKKIQPNRKTFIEMSEFLDIHLYNKGNIFQRRKGNKRQKFFEEKAFYSFDGIALMTNTLMTHYVSFPEKIPKLLHLPMTVDLDRFNKSYHPSEEFKAPYIAFVGVMNNAKDGVDILIESFYKIHQNFPTLKLYLVGSWNYDTPSHQARIKKLNMSDRVFWTGEKDRDIIPAILKNAQLLVLPRPDSKQARGGFPTKLGEYLASSVPVCATRVGEIPDYLVDNESVFFANPGSVDSFADAMNRALSDPENAKRVGLNGRRVAEKEFNKDIQAQKLYDFLKSL